MAHHMRGCGSAWGPTAHVHGKLREHDRKTECAVVNLHLIPKALKSSRVDVDGKIVRLNLVWKKAEEIL